MLLRSKVPKTNEKILNFTDFSRFLVLLSDRNITRLGALADSLILKSQFNFSFNPIYSTSIEMPILTYNRCNNANNAILTHFDEKN